MSERYAVSPEWAGRKLRDVLRGAMGIGYGAMKSAKWDGRILLDGIPATVDTPVREGQLVEFIPKTDSPLYTPKPYPLPLNIVYEDDHLFVIDKPAPLASQSGAGHPDDSLENALYAHLSCPANFVYRPVNRLDRGTSGLMIVAKSAHAQQRLQRLLHTEAFSRIYLAVTEGIPSPLSGTIDAPIAKENAASIRRIVDPSGKPSVTRYETLTVAGSRALVRLRLETGRTHQIRVHLANLGCPVCGDFLYGTELPELPGRFALHSAELFLAHPFTGEAFHWTSPLPEPLARLIDA